MEESPIRIGFVTAASDSDLRYLRQMGVSDVVSSLRGVEPGAVWEFEPMLALKNKVENAGLKLSVLSALCAPIMLRPWRARETIVPDTACRAGCWPWGICGDC